ncbi:MAG: MBOAT family O-acyltransferase [Chitinophagales bacterium]
MPVIKKWQAFILIGASLVFYSFQNPYLLILLLVSASASFYFTYQVFHSEGNKRKVWAICGVVFNLLVLIFFKYSGFLSSLFLGDRDITNLLITIPLPIGISFYTFHGISMVVDAFKNDETEKWAHDFSYKRALLYTVFFPQLIAGPIMRAKNFLPQIKIYSLQDIPVNFCFRHLLIGYFLKMFVADNLKEQTAYFSEEYLLTSLSTTTCIVLLIGYACQIFSDFAGYSYIARGLAGLFGYRIILNFNYPYIANSFSDFWRRWNISLSQFMKIYLYIPLGGNQKGRVRTYINLMITMGLAGLWHGASLGYLLWGIYHGIFLGIGRLLTNKWRGLLITIIRRLIVLIAVIFGWVFFIFPEKENFLLFFHTFRHNTKLPLHYSPVYFTLIYCVPVLLFHLNGYYKERKMAISQKWKPVAFAVMLFLIVWNAGTAGKFIYFQF